MSNKYLRYVVLTGLFAVPFVPLIVSSSLFFPFITGKAFVFRTIIEIIFACYLVLAVRDKTFRPKLTWPLAAVLVFSIIIGVADIFSENPFKSFWSNYERMEGYISLLHFGAYFLVLGSVFNTKKMWNRLLATSLGASTIMAIYCFFQLAGKIAINQGGVRVDGTLGNASYLGIYMVFHIFFAALLFLNSKKSWQKILLAAVALADLAILYFTATRGAILGFIAGLVITFIFLVLKAEKGSKIKKIAGIGIICLAIFAGIFFSIRNTSFVRSNMVLSRFASLSFSEIKTQGRYFVWPMAWKGFLEKPILGWGQESFNFVFNKNYDPRMYSQEPWFDRAHSTPLDWLIAGGALGLASYALMIFALLFCILKSRNEDLTKEEKAVMLGLASAYIFNNLFVFDQISSYILFFTILAMTHFYGQEVKFIWWEKISAKARNLAESERSKPVIEAFVLILTIAVLYFVIYVPWKQNRDLYYVLSLNNQGKAGGLVDYEKPLLHYTMGFPESLEHVSQAAMNLLSNQNASTELKQQLFDFLNGAFTKHLSKVPSDTRYRLFYALFLSKFGLHDQALEQLEKAKELSPNKQSIYFEMINNKLAQNKIPEALEIAKQALDLEPSYGEAKMTYGLLLAVSGDLNAAEKVFSSVEESKIIFDDRYLSVLLDYKQYQKIIDVAKRRVELRPNDQQSRITLAAAYLQANRRTEAVAVLEEIIKLNPAFKEQGEYYINEIKAGRNP